MQSNLLPIVIAVWVGFIGCIGILFFSRFWKTDFQRRMQQTLRPVDEDVQEILAEQHDEEMDRSLIQRVMQPVLAGVGRKLKAKVKNAQGEQIREMLVQAGHPLGMGYSEFMALKVFGLLTLTTFGFFSSFVVVPFVLVIFEMYDPQASMMVQVLYTLIFAFLGYSGPTFWLRKYVNARIRQIRKAMADVVDLIVLGIEAGLGFDSAVGVTVQKTKGPLTDELRRVLAEVNVGKPQGQAFADMANRVKMTDLTLLVAAIDQAMKMGVGLAHALRLQATEIREKRMAFIREQAGKLPVKMMLPLVLFIFPALFAVILGPAACQLAEMAARGELAAFG
jgi:tight adherence protein C